MLVVIAKGSGRICSSNNRSGIVNGAAAIVSYTGKGKVEVEIAVTVELIGD